MKKITQNILIILITLGVIAPLVSSCNDDDGVNEWNMNYVSLLPVDHLKPIPSYTFNHYAEGGVDGTVEFKVLATLLKVADKDVTVSLDATCENISAENIVMTSKTALIKAGSRTSDTITVSIKNWADINDIAEKLETKLKINLVDLEPMMPDVAISEIYPSITINIEKKIRIIDNGISSGTPGEGKLQTNIWDWTFVFMNGVENPTSNSVIGNGSGDVATNGVPFWLTVDLGTAKTLTGLQTKHWGASFAPKKIEIFVSENNRDWVELKGGTTATSGGTQNLKFDKPIQTRYLKYQMLTVPSRVDITKFYIYSLD